MAYVQCKRNIRVWVVCWWVEHTHPHFVNFTSTPCNIKYSQWKKWRRHQPYCSRNNWIKKSTQPHTHFDFAADFENVCQLRINSYLFMFRVWLSIMSLANWMFWGNIGYTVWIGWMWCGKLNVVQPPPHLPISCHHQTEIPVVTKKNFGKI